jgi:hypothetical protein
MPKIVYFTISESGPPLKTLDPTRPIPATQHLLVIVWSQETRG